MSRKKEPIVRFSAAELDASRAGGRTGSDWNAAATKPTPDGSDPDDAIEPVDRSTTELPMEHTNLRLDADILAFFRAQGPGYLTRINAVLRSYTEQVARPKSR